MYEYLKGVLEYGFANRCEGATVLGMEMNHLSVKWFSHCVGTVNEQEFMEWK
jgi:hypothetical protein